METEYKVLSHLQENETTTQRNISERTGLALGSVNLLLKKMVRKGLVKVERLNKRSVRYILTPQGIKEKSSLTYRYIKETYHLIQQINHNLDQLLADQENIDEDTVALCGPSDEIQEIITRHLEQNKTTYVCYPDAESINEPAGNNRLVLIWRPEEEESLNKSYRAVNVLSMLYRSVAGAKSVSAPTDLNHLLTCVTAFRQEVDTLCPKTAAHDDKCCIIGVEGV